LSLVIVSTYAYVDTILPACAADCKMVWPDVHGRPRFAKLSARRCTKAKIAPVPTERAKSTNQFLPMPPGSGMAWISAYIAQSSNRGGVYLTFAKAYDRGSEIYEVLESDRDAIEREVGTRLRWERGDDRVFIGAPHVVFTDLNSPADRQRVTAYSADMKQRLIRVFKPRLEAAAQEKSSA
jgi:hypothetical protein